MVLWLIKALCGDEVLRCNVKLGILNFESAFFVIEICYGKIRLRIFRKLFIHYYRNFTSFRIKDNLILIEVF